MVMVTGWEWGMHCLETEEEEMGVVGFKVMQERPASTLGKEVCTNICGVCGVRGEDKEVACR